MRIPDLLSLSTRMFTTRPMRTFLTILGVGIGIGAVLFLVSLGYGLQRVILSQITTADALLSLDVAPGDSGLVVLDDASLKNLEDLPEVTETARLKSFSGQIHFQGLSSDSLLQAVDPNFFRLHGLQVDQGEIFSSEASQAIVLSSAAAKLFNKSADEMLHQEVTMTVYVAQLDEQGFETVDVREVEQSFTVQGIIEDETSSFAYVPLQELGIDDIESYDLVKVKVAEQDALATVRDQIIARGYLVSSLSDIISQANQIFNVLQIILGLFGLIALVVSAIGMFNTMTIALLERINEIGIMRSVGVTRADIRKMFLIESMLMGFLGGLGGVLLGFLAGQITNVGLNFLAMRLGGRSLDLFYEPLWFVVVIIVFSTFIGFLTGIFPSRRAANMDPLEALRYK
ncbi:MAG: ABC transporter permease [Candidatus Nomurabacteria bacterium]|nr:MAG: ABC transporter permease [Candidatus Nomurabacteria bacterium]